MSTPPHVIHVVISLDHGGLERQVLSWAKERNTRFPESTSITCLDRIGHLGDEASGLSVMCVRSERGRIPWDLGAIKRMKREVLMRKRNNGVVVLHTHNLAAWQYGVLTRTGLDVKLIHTQHGDNIHDQSPLNTIRARLLMRGTHRVVTVSAETAAGMARRLRVPLEKIDVIPNGIDLKSYDANEFREAGRALRNRLGIPANAWVLGTVGRLAEVKGQDRLVKAFGDLLKSRLLPAQADRHLIFVGDGPLRSKLEQSVQPWGVNATRVHFTGFHADPRPYYAAMDLFVLPSRSEGLSIALLEALAMRVPVAATAVGSNASVLGKDTGLILDSNDTKWTTQLAMELIRIGVHGPDVTGRLEAGRRRVEQGFSLATSLDQYECLYSVGSGL